MSGGQRFALSVGLLLAIASGLFPPWKQGINLHGGESTIISERPLGYAFIANPPTPTWENTYTSVSPDFGRITLQCIILILFTAGGIFALRGFSIRLSGIVLACLIPAMACSYWYGERRGVSEAAAAQQRSKFGFTDTSATKSASPFTDGPAAPTATNPFTDGPAEK